jgi:hypothetical protein
MNFYDQSIHTVTGLVKLYFRELPEPLLTFESYDMFIAASGVPEKDARLQMIRKVLGFIPPTKYRLLKLLCCVFFTKFVLNKKKT